MLHALKQNKKEQTDVKEHIELLGKTGRYLTLWNYKGMCLMTVDTS